MILCNLLLEIEHLIDKSLLDSTIDKCLNEVMNVFYQEDSGLIMENVTLDGKFSDSFEGRLINPGHSLNQCGLLWILE